MILDCSSAGGARSGSHVVFAPTTTSMLTATEPRDNLPVLEDHAPHKLAVNFLLCGLKNKELWKLL